MTNMMAMMDRPMMAGGMGMGMPGMPMPAMGPGMTAAPGMMMVPRCTMKFETCKGGMTITCACEDDVAAATLQNLCRMMAGGMCSVCCMMNGMMVMQCNMAMCACKCEPTKDGVMVTCTTGDKACADMVQACCEAMQKCMDAGCCCCLCFGNTPCCCSTC